ncbi:molybdopterin-dependent oxidoreductase [Paludibacterium paludis]|uniref:Oxidoreductase n=1 Tax=Paludibacterium paludis TaxID=1225769 RepID=A0A918NZA7_9NEIS|nr:molybdopterin-dependent oxidoreductase [Paludibacterium paludis]GGY06306.1 oxidoreductase [Paludibacterium paludis]
MSLFTGKTVALVVCLALPFSACALDKPVGKPVLTLSGKITVRNETDKAVFDMAMLEKLPQRSFSTHTPWHKEAHTFTGPLLKDVLAQAGAEGKNLKALAINDYKTLIPVEDAMRFDVIIARLMDGKPMPVREKGPLFIIYPFDSSEMLRSELYYGRSAWQLKALIIE